MAVVLGWTQAHAALPLSLEAALQLAQSHSQALPAQDLAAQAARERAVAAGRLPDPVLRLALENMPSSGASRFDLNAEPMTMRSIGLMQSFPGGTKRQARRERLEREADVAQHSRALQTQTLRIQVAQAWFDLHFQLRELALWQRQRELLVQQADAVHVAYGSGRSMQSEVFTARAALARLDTRLLDAQAEVNSARSRLARWIGSAAEQTLAPPPAIERSEAERHSHAELIERHAKLDWMGARQRAVQAEAEVARQDKHADWDWFVSYNRRARQFGDMVSFGVSIPLQWQQSLRQDREVAASLAQAEQIGAEREEMRREHLADLQNGLIRWRSLLARNQAYEKSLLPLAQQVRQAVEAAYAGGKSSLAQVMEARVQETDAQMEQLCLLRQAASLWAELEYFSTPADPARSNPGVRVPTSTTVSGQQERQP